MVFKYLCILVLWAKVASALEGLTEQIHVNTGELGYDRLNGTRKIGTSHAKSVVYI